MVVRRDAWRWGARCVLAFSPSCLVVQDLGSLGAGRAAASGPTASGQAAPAAPPAPDAGSPIREAPIEPEDPFAGDVCAAAPLGEGAVLGLTESEPIAYRVAVRTRTCDDEAGFSTGVGCSSWRTLSASESVPSNPAAGRSAAVGPSARRGLITARRGGTFDLTSEETCGARGRAYGARCSVDGAGAVSCDVYGAPGLVGADDRCEAGEALPQLSGVASPTCLALASLTADRFTRRMYQATIALVRPR